LAGSCFFFLGRGWRSSSRRLLFFFFFFFFCLWRLSGRVFFCRSAGTSGHRPFFFFPSLLFTLFLFFFFFFGSPLERTEKRCPLPAWAPAWTGRGDTASETGFPSPRCGFFWFQRRIPRKNGLQAAGVPFFERFLPVRRPFFSIGRKADDFFF